ncbi:hypothetical protein PEL8287_02643 [Roseovarius litorisediminis]|uniref:Regulatory protein SoxS n=1 Tax=Roseovarius litorisediminis TaxID=1312363 RepID=A0A1Y5T2C9_9RHOB|nr:hypothetical protein [Roseovarius litorisediminis]SLN50595.1 hypothetical protein PEL8287_02643 [Roseovarius litorisediminis]
MRLLFAILATLLLVYTFYSPARAGELVMIERDGCHWCERWNTEIAHIYPKTDEGKRAPLRRVNISNLPDNIIFASRPIFTPTFILVENGQELGRVEGYAGPDFFWHLLGQLLNAHPGATGLAG